MTFSRKIRNINFNFNIDNGTLKRPDVIRDLGVIFDPKLSFGSHIESIVTTAFRSLGLVVRNGRQFNDIETLKLLCGPHSITLM